MTEHAPIMHHVVNDFATGGNREDLLHEVMPVVWKSISAFRGQAKNRTYL